MDICVRRDQYLQVLGMVNAVPGTVGMECVTVVNGFSDLLVEIWGRECGVGARSAVGVATLPINIPVEVEAVFEIKE